MGGEDGAFHSPGARRGVAAGKGLGVVVAQHSVVVVVDVWLGPDTQLDI